MVLSKTNGNTTLTTTYTYDEQTVSDLHKDAYGYRPRESFYYRWDTATAAERQNIWDNMCMTLESELELEKQETARNIERFESRVDDVLRTGALSRVQAIKWIAQSEDLYGSDYPPYEELEYRLGLPFRYVTGTLAQVEA
jgi:hypothetical protein